MVNLASHLEMISPGVLAVKSDPRRAQEPFAGPREAWIAIAMTITVASAREPGPSRVDGGALLAESDLAKIQMGAPPGHPGLAA